MIPGPLIRYGSAFALGMIIAATAQGWRYGAQIAEIEKGHAEATEKAQRRAREEEQRRQSAIEEIRENAQDQINKAAADAVAADSAADGLRAQLDRLKRRAANCASSSTGSQASTDSTAMLADMLTQVESAGRAMAAQADRRRVAGLACEAAYNAITPNLTLGR